MIFNIVFESKWGFHPCDYQTYLKLKFLNRAYSLALKARGAWERWERKQERTGIEPKQFPVFEWVFKSQPYGDAIRLSNFGEEVRKAVRISRHPVPTTEEVKHLGINEGIVDVHYKFLKKWIKEHKV